MWIPIHPRWLAGLVCSGQFSGGKVYAPRAHFKGIVLCSQQLPAYPSASFLASRYAALSPTMYTTPLRTVTREYHHVAASEPTIAIEPMIDAVAPPGERMGNVANSAGDNRARKRTCAARATSQASIAPNTAAPSR